MNQASLFDEPGDVERFDPMPLALAVGRGPVVLVDELQQWGVATEGRAALHFGAGKSSCHMTVTGAFQELHLLAVKIGLRYEWFQARASWPHYDLTTNKRVAALRAGAMFCPAAEQAKIEEEARREIRARGARDRCPVSLQAWETIVADCWAQWVLRVRGLP
jgi:hypothetical protein